jgi:PhzF family phenazine biosynthesis protein
MSMKLKLYQIDAFTNRIFQGNPAAVFIINEWLSDELMQKLGLENNLSETAFVVPKGDEYEIRWFTPNSEVDLCGHATLASAHVLFEHYNHPTDKIIFQSKSRGKLTVRKNADATLTLDFPVDIVDKVEQPESLKKAFNINPIEYYKGKTDYLFIYSKQENIENLEPDFNLILASGERGVIVSAPGNNTDFVSRFFAPQVGVNEDPVTGSAHTTLTPVWSNKLGKTKLTARQLSKRGGDLICELVGDRVKITGSAVKYLIGEIEI